MTGSKGTKLKTPTHEERERAFANIFGTVRADASGTGMGSNDKERDQALSQVTFDKIPEKVDNYEVPEVAKPKFEHPSLMDDLHKKGGPAKPLIMDEKTKTFYQLFDHVTPGQENQYGGQAYQPDAEVEFEKLPSEVPKNDLPEIAPKISQKPREEVAERVQKEEKHSERYQKAHSAYVKVFGDIDEKE